MTVPGASVSGTMISKLPFVAPPAAIGTGLGEKVTPATEALSVTNNWDVLVDTFKVTVPLTVCPVQRTGEPASTLCTPGRYLYWNHRLLGLMREGPPSVPSRFVNWTLIGKTKS